jgi:hypothetical protein
VRRAGTGDCRRTCSEIGGFQRANLKGRPAALGQRITKLWKRVSNRNGPRRMRAGRNREQTKKQVQKVQVRPSNLRNAAAAQLKAVTRPFQTTGELQPYFISFSNSLNVANGSRAREFSLSELELHICTRRWSVTHYHAHSRLGDVLTRADGAIGLACSISPMEVNSVSPGCALVSPLVLAWHEASLYRFRLWTVLSLGGVIHGRAFVVILA